MFFLLKKYFCSFLVYYIYIYRYIVNRKRWFTIVIVKLFESKLNRNVCVEKIIFRIRPAGWTGGWMVDGRWLGLSSAGEWSGGLMPSARSMLHSARSHPRVLHTPAKVGMLPSFYTSHNPCISGTVNSCLLLSLKCLSSYFSWYALQESTTSVLSPVTESMKRLME